jgi:hypothetical protein
MAHRKVRGNGSNPGAELNPNGIKSISLGLREMSYPRSTIHPFINPERVASRAGDDSTLSGLEYFRDGLPGVAAPRQSGSARQRRAE